MKKLILIVLFIIGVLFILESKVTMAKTEPCKYYLDLEKEECCRIGGNCCGPFC